MGCFGKLEKILNCTKNRAIILIRKTLLEIIEINREALMVTSSMALHILSLIHKNYDDIADDECSVSLALNDSIARMLYHADYEGAIASSRQALARLPQSSDAYFTVRHLALIGRCLTLSGSFGPGEEALQRALAKAKHLENESMESIKLRADILHDLAMNNDMSQGRAGTSMRYLEKALDLLESTSMEVRKGVCHMGLGNVSYGIREIEPALEYYLRAAEIFENESNLANLAAVSSNIGLCYTDLGKLKLAESHLIRSLNLRKSIGNPEQIAISYHNLARLYENMGDIDHAFLNMRACRDLARYNVNKHLYNIAQEWMEQCPITESDLDGSSLIGLQSLKLKVA